MIEIKDYDTAFLDIDERKVKSFTFIDPDKAQPTDNIYCVGVQCVEGEPESPDSWRHDHTNYWPLDTDPNSDGDPGIVQKAELDAVLLKHQTNFRALLTEFIRLAYLNEKEDYEKRYGKLELNCT